MSIGFVIWFASIADSMKIILVILLFGMFGIMAFVHFKDGLGVKSKLVAALLISLTIFIGLAAALMPLGDAVYKIAGVTSQERARIDAAGNIVKED